MKKLRLDCEELRVESFPTAAASDEAGTVHGHAVPEYAATLLGASCPLAICDTYNVCGPTQSC